MIQIEINGKQYNVAEGLNELTLEEYQRIFDFEKIDADMPAMRQDSIIVSRLLGEADDFCLNLPIDAYDAIVEQLGWLYDKNIEPKQKMECEINGKMYYILPSEKMTTRKFVDLDVISKDEAFPDRYFAILSILLEEDKDKENYNGLDTRRELMEELKQMKADEIVPLLLGFFLSSKKCMVVQGLYSILEQMETILSQEVENYNNS